MKSKKLFIFLMLSVILVGCDVLTKDSYDYMDEVETTNLSKESIENIQIGSSENEIIKQFGSSSKEDKNDAIRTFSYDNEGLVLLLKNNKLFEYKINNSKYSTSKGIKVGDTKQIVIEKYGVNYYTKNEEGGYSDIGYFDKENNFHIEFGLKNNKVIYINVVDILKIMISELLI